MAKFYPRLLISAFAATCGLVFAAPVFAASQVPGGLPQVQPLQPLPDFVKPNIERNINTPPEQIQSPGPGEEKSLAEAGVKSDLNAQASRQKKNILATLAALVLIAVIFYFGFKKNGQE